MNKLTLSKNYTFNIFSWLFNIFLLALVIIMILKAVVYQQVIVDGKSSYPNYDDNQILLVNQLDKNFDRGQVVAVISDRQTAKQIQGYFDSKNYVDWYFSRFNVKFYLKRIIAMPGECIKIDGYRVTIYNDQYPDGALLAEDYVSPQARRLEELSGYNMEKVCMPENEYFLMGDNRSNSEDSRKLGSFPDYALFGQEEFRIWPLNTFHVFKLPEYKFISIND